MVTSTLSERQRAMSSARATGRGIWDAGAAMGLTTSGAEYTLRRLCEALDARDATHALAICVVRGLITVEELRRAGVW